MTVALWCVLIAAILPLLATGVAKFVGTQGRYDNRDPRAFLERQQGLSRRADNAQKNSFEAFPFFAAGVIVAQMLMAPQAQVDAAAVVFILARLAYLAAYLADRPGLRSAVWTVGWLCCVILFLLGA
jgi:uncharacterized MAPEG superfamily protein